MFKKFLVPVDGSPSSMLAYRKAVELAKITGAEIVLLCVEFDVDHYARKGVLFARNYYKEDETKSRSTRIFAETRKNVDDQELPVSELILYGDPARKILEEAAKPGYDLIVMGSRGNKPFTGAVLGSVSQNITASSIRPVLVVKDAQEKLQEILQKES